MVAATACGLVHCHHPPEAAHRGCVARNFPRICGITRAFDFLGQESVASISASGLSPETGSTDQRVVTIVTSAAGHFTSTRRSHASQV